MQTRPLIIDLDGTLFRSDLLHEAIILIAFRKPWNVLLLPLWLMRGKAYFKQRIAELATPVINSQPTSNACLELIQEAKQAGRQVILATASPESYATAVQRHFPQLDACMASNGQTNLGGHAKAAALVARFGQSGFDYAGNAQPDFCVWDVAQLQIAINPDRGTARRFNKLYIHGRLLRDGVKGSMQNYLRMLRPQQWAKNLLVFVPLLTAHKYAESALLLNSLLALAAFCMVASAIYIINDLHDLEHDRQHPVKRQRPLAAGVVAPLHGLALVPVLLSAAAGLCLFLPKEFAFLLLSYLGITTAYSFWLKRKLLLDVFTLAGLYTLRIFAGAAAIEVAVSPWLLLLSIFLFFSLALVKRYAELRRQSSEGIREISGRGYNIDDMQLLSLLGVSSGLLSVLVLALYINSEQVVGLYTAPDLLWGSCVLLMYWVARVWILASRGQVEEDPINFAMRDRNSLFTGLLLLAIFAIAI